MNVNRLRITIVVHISLVLCRVRLDHERWWIEHCVTLALDGGWLLFDFKVHVHVLNGSLVDELIRLLLLRYDQVAVVNFGFRLVFLSGTCTFEIHAGPRV